jgi:hypothetical protein
VSRPWSRSVRMRIGRHAVSATLSRAWPRAATLASAQHWVEPAPAQPVDAPKGAPNASERESIDTVLSDLDRTSPLRGAALRVQLADALVHLDVIEGDFAGHTDRQLHQIAGACVAELLGESAGDHEVRWQLQADDRHMLICALPRPHLSLLETAASAHDLRLDSVQPAFVRLWNVHARALARGPAVFAVSSGTDLAIAWSVDGVIRAISAGPLFESPSPAHPAPGAAAIDRAVAVEGLDSRIGGLLVGFGLQDHARSAFAPTQPNPLEWIDMLDLRADRLLTGIGQDPASVPLFVLASLDSSTPAVSQRWAVTGRSKAAP